jgi:ribosomal protein S18 acetylase RimI-like enzyme
MIRKATLEDAVLLSKLGAETFYETFADQNTKEDMELYLQETFTPEKISQELINPISHFFILEEDQNDIGYTKLRIDNSSMEIERIYVRKEFQGRKFGKTLLEHAIRQARQFNCYRIFLGVWEKNQKAINFYKSFGFQIYGSHIFLLGKDPQNDLLMELNLEDR